MKKLKQFWNYLKGKKRNIGIGLTLVLRGLTLFFPSVLPTDQAVYIQTLIDIFLAGGVLDNLRRSTVTGQKIDAAIRNQSTVASDKVKSIINSKK